MGTNYAKIFYKDYEELFERKNKPAQELRTAHYNYQLPEQKEVNNRIKHELNECPECHKGLEKIGTIEKDVLDYKIVVEKTQARLMYIIVRVAEKRFTPGFPIA